MPGSVHLMQFSYCACAQGFAWDLAATYHGLLIFIEHRYYGESLPFGSSSYQDTQHLNFLSSGQALADFAVIITATKVHVHSHTQCHVCVHCINLSLEITFSMHYCTYTETTPHFSTSDCCRRLLWRYII